jgi:hypothetical protein
VPSDLVTVDTTSGAVTTIGTTGVAALSGLAYEPVSARLFGVTAGNAANADLVSLDLGNGAATVIGSLGHNRVGALELGPDGNLYAGVTDSGATNPSFLLRIDPLSGSATPIADTGFSITGLTNCQRLPAIVEVPTVSGAGVVLLAGALLVVALSMLGRSTRPDL